LQISSYETEYLNGTDPVIDSRYMPNPLKMYLEIDNPQHSPDVKIEHLWPHSFLKRIQRKEGA